MRQTFDHINKIKGELNLPGDKSISHRAVIFSSLADGTSKIKNLSEGEDVKTTRKCFEAMGIEIQKDNDIYKIKGKGFKGLKKPDHYLDCGNSGTTTRLISGILISQDFPAELRGDLSLSKRPMKRVIDPLTAMGGKIEASPEFTLPLRIFPAGKIKPIAYELPVASAQVKSAVLLAGLHTEGITTVIESVFTRDHTERMLGLDQRMTDKGKIVSVSKLNYPVAAEYFIPSDISSAAFFIVLALLAGKSELVIKNISLNETRTGFLDILKAMGAKIEVLSRLEIAGEPLGDIIVQSSRLHNTKIPEAVIPNLIDEIPILSVAGLFADGNFEIRNAKELRTKESDRIRSVCSNYRKLGLDVKEFEDGFSVAGEPEKTDAAFESFDDHRIAMAFSVLSMLLKEGGKVNNFDCVNISNPGFLNQLKLITG